MLFARRALTFALPALALGCALGLGASGCTLVARAPGPPAGVPAPDFTLPSHEGPDIHLAALRRLGPVVVVFYRGFW